MNREENINFVDKFWDHQVIPNLSQYISIPCKAPFFDQNWRENGFFTQAINLVSQWVRNQNIPGTQIESICLSNHSPFLYIDIPGNSGKTTLFYGHLDKMPEATGWREDLGPWQPVVKDGKLYGRGSVDNGYSTFSAITAIKSLCEQNLVHDRFVFLLETAEECGSVGIEEYLEYFKKRIGMPSLVVILDTGCSDYDRLWLTDSLRGLLTGKLQVDILSAGIHSGVAGGVVPSTFRIIRNLLDRIEDSHTGKILVKNAYTDIPQEKVTRAKFMAQILGKKIYNDFSLLEGCSFEVSEPHELLLNRSWRPSLSVIGAAGIPSLELAGNLLRPSTTLLIGLRIPPYCKAAQLIEEIKSILESDPPYDAKVTFTPVVIMDGWAAPKMSERLENIISDASRDHFGDEPVYAGCGGTLGTVKFLSKYFGDAQFIITGVEGPDSYAHGPNESLDLTAAKKMTAAVASILAKHSKK